MENKNTITIDGDEYGDGEKIYFEGGEKKSFKSDIEIIGFELDDEWKGGEITSEVTASAGGKVWYFNITAPNSFSSTEINIGFLTAGGEYIEGTYTLISNIDAINIDAIKLHHDILLKEEVEENIYVAKGQTNVFYMRQDASISISDKEWNVSKTPYKVNSDTIYKVEVKAPSTLTYTTLTIGGCLSYNFYSNDQYKLYSDVNYTKEIDEEITMPKGSTKSIYTSANVEVTTSNEDWTVSKSYYRTDSTTGYKFTITAPSSANSSTTIKVGTRTNNSTYTITSVDADSGSGSGSGSTDTGSGSTDTGSGSTDTGSGSTDTGSGSTDTGSGSGSGSETILTPVSIYNTDSDETCGSIFQVTAGTGINLGCRQGSATWTIDNDAWKLSSTTGQRVILTAPASNATTNLTVSVDGFAPSKYEVTSASELDKKNPTINNVAINETNWTKDDVTITVNASDTGSGLADQPYSFDGGTSWQESNEKTYTQNTSGIIIKVRDAAGNVAEYGTTIDIANIDKTAPTIRTVSGENEISVIVEDNDSGISENAFLSYRLTNTLEVDEKEWLNIEFNKGEQNEVDNGVVKQLTWTINTSGFKGKYYLWIQEEVIYDGATNSNSIDSAEGPFYYDDTAPEIEIDPSKLASYEKGKEIKIKVTDNESGISDNSRLVYAWSTSNEKSPEEFNEIKFEKGVKNDVDEDGMVKQLTWTIPKSETSELTGEYYLWIKGFTIKNNTPAMAERVVVSGVFKFDNKKPTINDVSKIEETNNVTITVEASDTDSGLATEAYSFDGGTSWQESNEKTYTQNTSGIIIKVRDAAGNVAEYGETIDIDNIIDKTAPTISSVTISETHWTKNNVTITVEASDTDSGLATEAYSFDGGENWQASNQKTYKQNTNGIVIKVKDAAGNVAKIGKAFNIDNIDKTGPTISIDPSAQSSYVNDGKEIIVTATDSGAGMSENAILLYGWSTDNSELGEKSFISGEPIKLVSENISGSEDVTWTIPASDTDGLTGTYYLWIIGGPTTDNLGNSNTQYVSAAFNFDNTAPVIDKNGNADNTMVNKYKTINIPLKITENHSGINAADFTKEDITIKVAGKEITPNKTLTYNSVSDGIYTYTLTLSNLTGDGALSLSIPANAISDNAGNQSEQKEINTGVTVDNTPPTISKYTDGNSTWAKSQTASITTTDNITSTDKIIITYEWKLNEVTEDGDTITNTANGTTLTKDNVTGKYILVFHATDLAGNSSSMITTNEFYIDNSITKPGTITATIGSKDGKQYLGGTPTLSSEYNDHGNYKNGYTYSYEGIYTTQNIYITLNDGTDNESGIKSTSYKITKDGKTVIESGAITDVMLEEKGIYEVIVTTTDNCDNKTEITYTIKIKEPTADISDSNNATEETKKETTVDIDLDNIPDDAKISYTIVEVEEKETKEETIEKVKENTSINWITYKEGQKITITGKTGNYRIVLKIEYPSTGETEYIASDIYKFNNKVDKVATLIIKENDANGKDYNNYTKENVYIKLNNDAEDSEGIDTSYFTVSGNDKVTDYSNGVSATLTEEGLYTVRVTTKDKLGNTGTRDYTVKIDRTAPQVTFPSKSTSNISVGITETNNFDSGINDSLRYYWTKNPYLKETEVTEDDFYGVGEGTYRGKITKNSASNTTATIRLPQEDGYSGNWYLWVYAKDEAGNVSITAESKIETGDNTQGIDKEKPISGEIIATYEKDGSNYVFTDNSKGEKEGNYTNENIVIKLTNGYDSYSGVSSNTATIKKGNNTVGTIETGETYTITEDSIYTITVTTKDKSSNTQTATYIIKIDKTAPTIQVETNDEYGIDEYATKHSVTITVIDLASGVEESKLKYQFINSNDLTIEKGEVKLTDKQKTNIKENGTTFTNGGTIETPKGVTGTYYLIVYAEDKCSNGTYYTKGEFKLDNTNPTKPIEITATTKEKIGTEEEEQKYYENTVTGKDVTVKVEGSTSESGVDKYQYRVTTDEGKTWTEWTDCTTVKDNNIYGSTVISNNGKTVIKFRSISVLADGELYSEESEEFTIIQDKEEPSITFDKNGQEEKVEKIEVTISVIDNYKVDENSLKYIWVEASKVPSNATESQLKALMTNSITFINGAQIQSPNGADGEYRIIVSASDIYGNETIEVSKTYNLGIVDTIAPEVTFDKNGQEEKVEKVEVTISVTDNTQVNENSLKYIWVEASKVPSNATESQLKALMTNSITFINGAQIQSPDGADGEYRIIVSASDIYGNETIEVSNTYNLGIVDTIAPEVTFANVTDGENGEIEKLSSVKVRVTVTDNVQINENLLKYAWIKFNSKEEFDTFASSTKTNNQLEEMMETTKSFANGEPIPSDEGLDGVYSLFVIAEDMAGNKTIAYSNSYYLGMVITEYEYENMYIKKVSPNTDVETFLNIVKEKINGTEYKVYDKENEEISAEDLVTTSSKLVVDGQKTYIIAVNGDTNADGKISISDLVGIRKHIVREKLLENEYLMAADVNNDSKISISDIVKLRKAIVKLIEL